MVKKRFHLPGNVKHVHRTRQNYQIRAPKSVFYRSNVLPMRAKFLAFRKAIIATDTKTRHIFRQEKFRQIAFIDIQPIFKQLHRVIRASFVLDTVNYSCFHVNTPKKGFIRFPQNQCDCNIGFPDTKLFLQYQKSLVSTFLLLSSRFSVLAFLNPQ